MSFYVYSWEPLLDLVNLPFEKQWFDKVTAGGEGAKQGGKHSDVLANIREVIKNKISLIDSLLATDMAKTHQGHSYMYASDCCMIFTIITTIFFNSEGKYLLKTSSIRKGIWAQMMLGKLFLYCEILFLYSLQKCDLAESGRLTTPCTNPNRWDKFQSFLWLMS